MFTHFSCANLRIALDVLPHESIKHLSEIEMEPIKIAIAKLHSILSRPLGTGDGWEITDHINVYLEKFFDMYLKSESNQRLEKCIPLTNNSFIDCGPGVF